MKYLIEKENKKETEQKSIFTVLFNLDRMNSLFPGFFSIILFFYINHKEASIMDIDELNILHGKILKARLRGDEEKAKELEAKLQEATKQTNQRIDLLLLCPIIPIRIDFLRIEPEEKEETKQPEEESKIEFIAPVDSKGRLLTALISSVFTTNHKNHFLERQAGGPISS